MVRYKPPKKSCSKVRFVSARDAYTARKQAESKGFNYSGTHVYRCPYCDGAWHLGHPPLKKGKRQ